MALANNGKWVSERHALAEMQGKLTAGDVNKLFKKHKIKTSSSEIVKVFKFYFGYQPEWHHSGFYNGKNGRTMGRTWFLSRDQANELLEKWDSIITRYNNRL